MSIQVTPLILRSRPPNYAERRLADAYDLSAAVSLVRLLVRRGDLAGLRARAGHLDGSYSARELARLLAERGDLDQAVQILRARADAGDFAAARHLAGLLAEHGDLAGLRARADVGDEYAARQLAGLLADRGDLDALYDRAAAGDRGAAGYMADLLADLLAKRGRGEEAERLRRFGLNPDGSIA